MRSETQAKEEETKWRFIQTYSGVRSYAFLNLWIGWPNDVTSIQHAGVFLGGVGALSTIIFGNSRGKSISSGENLSTTMFSVPPGDVVVFEVALLMDYENGNGGNFEAGFESGDFQIACPVVVFSLLNSPRV